MTKNLGTVALAPISNIHLALNKCHVVWLRSYPTLFSTAFEYSSLVNLIVDGGTVLLNVPLGSGNSLSNSSEVFGTGLKYLSVYPLSIDIF